ncbi:MAG: hypothetical protein JSV33_04845 [bacterium]|nr:MAG: hypothetical protein JSV33_04845 [bacterium]
MPKITILVSALSIFCGLILLLGCSEDLYVGTPDKNEAPEIWLSSGPIERDTTGYQVHFYWSGWDPDGEISHFEFVVVDATDLNYGFNPEDTTGSDKWYRTVVHDSLFRVTADEYAGNDTINANVYSRFNRAHTFFIRAIDLEGKPSIPARRSFTAWTFAPEAHINRPVSGGGLQVLSRVITFGWDARDPIDSPANSQDPDSIRYLWSQVVDTEGVYSDTFDIVRDLNRNPWRYEERENWSNWIWYRAEGDSGRVTILGDDEILEINKRHIFAVQAKDEAGAVTQIFERDGNLRMFIVSKQAGPLLLITEPFLGGFRFLGTNLRDEKRDLPPGIPLNFRWRADASSYGGEIKSYRYGWDVDEVTNPEAWDVLPSPYITSAPERKLYIGVHRFSVEVMDNAGTLTRGTVEINVVPFTMEKNLLWVDDFYSLNTDIEDKSHPPEYEHDAFWEDICDQATDWTTEDIYDCQANNLTPPDITLIGQYKNIIWTFSSANDAWRTIVYFTPESRIGQGSQLTVNYLSLFLAKGGHLWTLGRSERGGGLAAILAQNAQNFPMNLRCEITGNSEGCEGDTSGVNCMAYKDYCITMLDKVKGVFRTDEGMPTREVDFRDAMAYAYKDTLDPVTNEYPGLPDSLELADEVTELDIYYFNPNHAPGGFTYVEVYDPFYWMDLNFVDSQPCFHPMYRMRARSTRSAIDLQTVALWLTKYEDVEPDVKSGIQVAARSVHFGFPLWFFDRTDVNRIARIVFNEWQILETP